MNQNEKSRLVQAASAASSSAYAPYSNFKVGAALACDDGAIVVGCNVENASYGLTICAERVAFCAAVAAGRRRFHAIAIVTAGGGIPCGACRQFMAEFCDDRFPILMADAADTTRWTETTLGELLPQAFRCKARGASC